MIDMIMKAPGIMYLVFVKVYFVIGDKIYPTPVVPRILKISQGKWQRQSVLVFHNSSAIFSKSNLKEKSRQFQYFSWNLLILEQSPTHWPPTHWGWEKTIQNSQQQSNTTFYRFSNYRSADTNTKTNTDSLLSLMYNVLKFDFVNNIYMLPNTC